MPGNNNMNMSSLAYKGRARKGFRSKKKMVKFSNQKCSVYRYTFVMQPRQHQSSATLMSRRTKCAEKAKEKAGKERETKEEKMLDQIGKKKKKCPCAYIIPP